MLCYAIANAPPYKSGDRTSLHNRSSFRDRVDFWCGYLRIKVIDAFQRSHLFYS
ncbi:hypothetical protein [Nostoc sp. C057]|uniref:hypothetical protein n=1 Tax=Nostoc sp. C057 TaxID=2576903 RepID=UPI0015C3F7BE|nr:hypothetical protein [Nostoc sp. C057]